MSNPLSPTRPKFIRLEIEEYERLDAIKDRLEKDLVKAEGVIEWLNKYHSEHPDHPIPDQAFAEQHEAFEKHNELSRYLGREIKYPEFEGENEKDT